MLKWGIIVAVLLVAGSLPRFIGVAVVLPGLGYSTWHHYTRRVDRSAAERAGRAGPYCGPGGTPLRSRKLRIVRHTWTEMVGPPTLCV